MWFSGPKPVCRTNISLPGNALDVSDHVEIQCSVRYNGIWIPAFICAPHLPGTTVNHTSASHVLHKRVIAASDIEDLSELNCSMTFSLTADYQTRSPEIPRKPEKPVFDFVWNTSSIRIVDLSGKYTDNACAETFCATCYPN